MVLLKLWQSFLYNDVKKTLMSAKEREKLDQKLEQLKHPGMVLAQQKKYIS